MPTKSKALADYAHVAYVDQFFLVDGTTVILRDEPVQPPPVAASGSAGSKQGAQKVPPKPRKQTCSVRHDFHRRGSTACMIRSTCLDCGHANTERWGQTPQFRFEDCPHTQADHRGSSRSVFTTFCKMCHEFIDQMPLNNTNVRFTLLSRSSHRPWKLFTS